MKTTGSSAPFWISIPTPARCRSLCPSAGPYRQAGRSFPAKGRWTAFSWLCSSAILLALAACTTERDGGTKIALRETTIVSGERPILRLRLDFRPSPQLLAALERGIPLTIEWRLELKGASRWCGG